MKTATRISPSTITNQAVPSIGSQFVSSAGPTLKSISAKPIAIANEKMIWPREISVTTFALVVLLARGDVRGDRERAEADRERLAERDDAADRSAAARSGAAASAS